MTQFSKWKIIGYTAAIFVVGGISGGALGVYETKSQIFVPQRQRDVATRIRNHLQSRLGLSPDQMAKVDPIIDSAASEIRSIRMDAAQRVIKVFDASYAQISAILNPAQRIKLAEIQKERREMMQRAQSRWQEGHRHPSGGGPEYDEPPHGSPGPVPSGP